jgi:hypothetical protein
MIVMSELCFSQFHLGEHYIFESVMVVGALHGLEKSSEMKGVYNLLNDACKRGINCGFFQRDVC